MAKIKSVEDIRRAWAENTDKDYYENPAHETSLRDNKNPINSVEDVRSAWRKTDPNYYNNTSTNKLYGREEEHQEALRVAALQRAMNEVYSKNPLYSLYNEARPTPSSNKAKIAKENEKKSALPLNSYLNNQRNHPTNVLGEDIAPSPSVGTAIKQNISADSIKKEYESIPEYNLFERMGSKVRPDWDYKNDYARKQELQKPYDAIKTAEAHKDLLDMGYTEEDFYDYGHSYVTEEEKEELRKQGKEEWEIEAYEKERSKRSNDILNKITEDLNAQGKDTKYYYDFLSNYKTEGDIEYAKDNPVEASVGSLALNPIESTINVGGKLIDYSTGKPLTSYQSATNVLREGASENFKTDFGKTGYMGAMSIGDTAVAALTAYATGGGSIVSAGMQAIEKASQVLDESAQRDITPDQMIALGVASGITTYITEKIPMGNLDKIVENGITSYTAKEIGKTILAQMVSEGLQEPSEDIADWIADALITGDKNQFNTDIKSYMYQGMSEDQALAKVIGDRLQEAGIDSFFGAMGGLTLGAAGVGAGYTFNRNVDTNTQPKYDDAKTQMLTSLTDAIKSVDVDSLPMNTEKEMSYAYQMGHAQEVANKPIEELTDDDIADLTYSVMAIDDRNREEALSKISETVKILDSESLPRNTEEEKAFAERIDHAKELANKPVNELKEDEVADMILAVNDAVKAENDRTITMLSDAAKTLNPDSLPLETEEDLDYAIKVEHAKEVANKSLENLTDEDISDMAEAIEGMSKDNNYAKAIEEINNQANKTRDMKTNIEFKIKGLQSEIGQKLIDFSENFENDVAAKNFIDNYNGQNPSMYASVSMRAYRAGQTGQSFDTFMKSDVEADLMVQSGEVTEAYLKTIFYNGENARGEVKTDFNIRKNENRGTYYSVFGEDETTELKKAVAKALNAEIVEEVEDEKEDYNGRLDIAFTKILLNPNADNTLLTMLHEMAEYTGAYNAKGYELAKNVLTDFIVKKAGEERFIRVVNAYRRSYQEQARKALKRNPNSKMGAELNKTFDDAHEEFINDVWSYIFTTEEGIRNLGTWVNENEDLSEQEKLTFFETIKQWLDNLVKAIKSYMSKNKTDQLGNMFMESLDITSEELDNISRFLLTQVDQARKNLASATEGEGQSEVKHSFEVTAEEKAGVEINGDGEMRFSMAVYENSGKDYLKDYLKKYSGLSKKDQKDIIETLDWGYQIAKEMQNDPEMRSFSNWSDTTLEFDAEGKPLLEVFKEDGRPIRSVVVNNGEYPLNIDFSQVCKKRIALNNVLNKLVSDADLNLAILTESDIAGINRIIKEHQFEIACGLCFVDSKRYRVGSWANSFVNGTVNEKTHKKESLGWNDLVNSMIPKGASAQYFNLASDHVTPLGTLLDTLSDDQINFKTIDKIIKPYLNKDGKLGTAPEEARMAYLLKTEPSVRMLLDPNDIIASEGLDLLRSKYQDVYNLVNAHGGTSKPKLSHGFTAYGNDILKARDWKGKKNQFIKENAYAVGGVRVQSFSDYVANLFFDYMQMFADMSARELPSHAYTKEPTYVRLFGMTGQRINMSLIFKGANLTQEQSERLAKLLAKGRAAVLADEEFGPLCERAGLDENGNYIFEDESFDFEEAKAIQNDPRYKYCGTIGVGLSNMHIRKMLNDSNIKMIIPYHASGVSQLIKNARNLGLYTDYTEVQNTRGRDGKKLAKGDGFDWYGRLKSEINPKGLDAKKVADEYLKYCDEKGYIPKFDAFRDHPNYYKLLIDFRAYDNEGNFMPQGPVKMNFPEEAEFKKLVSESLIAQQETEDRMEKEMSGEQNTLYREVKDFLKEQGTLEEIDDVRHSLKVLPDGTKYIKLDGNLFDNGKGGQLSPRAAYKKLINTKYLVVDGDEIYFINRLPKGKEMYDELFKRRPKSKNISDISDINDKINRNIIELVEYSDALNKNIPDFNNRHSKYGIVSFDTREVHMADDVNAYRLELSIAKLQDNRKIAYAKRFVEPDTTLLNKIKAATTGQSPQKPPSNAIITPQTKNTSPNNGGSVHSLSVPTTDSTGRTLSEGQIERNKDSKARDSEGNLMQMYHGTSGPEFDVFDRRASDDKRSFFFSSNKDVSATYGETIMPVYLNIVNPLEIDARGANWNHILYEQTESFKIEPTRVGDYLFLNKKAAEDFTEKYDIENLTKAYDTAREEGETEYKGKTYDESELADLLKKADKEYSNYYAKYRAPITLREFFDNYEKYSWKDLHSVMHYYDPNGLSLEEMKEYNDSYEDAVESFRSYLEEEDEEAFGDTPFVLPVGQDMYEGGLYATTRRLSEMAEKSGKDGVIIRNVYDTATGKKLLSDVMIAFKSNQIKSIYNLNPTDSDNKRFSFSVSGDDFFDSFNEIDNQVKLEESDLEKFLKEKMDFDSDVTKKAVKDVASNIKKQYNSNIKLDRLTADIMSVFKYLKATGNLSMKDVMFVMSDIARPVLENTKNTDPEQEKRYKDFTDYMKSYNISLDAGQMAEVANAFGSYYEYQRAMRGKMNVSKNGTTNLDSVWTEICDRAGGELSYGTNPNDQPIALAEYLNSLTPTYQNLEGQSLDEAATDLALEIFRQFYVYQSMNDAAEKVQGELNRRSTKIKQQYKDAYNEAIKQVEYEKALNVKRLAEEIDNLTAEEQEAIRNGDALNKAMIENLKNDYIRRLNRLRAESNNKIAQAKAKYRNAWIEKNLNRERSELKHRVLREVKALQNIIAHPSEGATKHVPINLIKPTIEMLEAINLDNGGRNKAIAERLKKMSEVYESFKNDERYSFDYDERIARDIEELRELFEGKSYADLEITELERVIEIVTALKTQIKNANNLILQGKYKDAQEAASSAMTDVRQSRRYDNAAMNVLNRYANNHLNAYREFRKLSGYGDGVLMDIYNNLDEGSHREMQIQKDLGEIFRDVLEGQKNQKEVKKFISTKKEDLVDIGITDRNGKPILITKAMRMSLIMHSMNAGNMRHVLGSGITIPNMYYFEKGKMDEAYAKGTNYRFVNYQELLEAIQKNDTNKIEELTTQAQQRIEALRDDLSDWEKDFLADAEKMFHDETGKLINDTSMALKGYAIARVKNYFPIKTDSHFTTQDWSGLVQNGSLEGSGVLKERVVSTKPILLEDITNVIERQIRFTSKYAGLAVAVRNFDTLMKQTSRDQSTGELHNLYETIDSVWGASDTKWLKNLMQDIQGGRSEKGNWLMNLRGQFAGATLTLNPSVAIKQAASYPTAAAVVGWKALGRAAADIGKGFGGTGLAELEKINPLLWYRMQGFGTQELADAKAVGFGKNLPQWAQKAINWTQWFDTGTVRTLEYAAKYYVDDNFDLKEGSEEYWQKVSEVFTNIVEQTQPNYSTLHKADIIRNPNSFVKMLVMFKTQPMQNFGIIYDAMGELNAAKISGNKKWIDEASTKAARAISSQVVSATVFSAMTILSQLLLHRWWKYRDDEGNWSWEKFWVALGDGALSTVAGAFIGGSVIYDFLKEIFTKETYYGIEVSVVEMLNDLRSNISKVVDTADDLRQAKTSADREKYTQKLLKYSMNVGTSIGEYTGTPVNNIKNIISSMYFYSTDIVKSIDEGELSISDDSNLTSWEIETQYERIYQAFQNNDVKKYEKLVNELKDAAKEENPEMTEDEIAAKVQENVTDKITSMMKADYLEGNISEEEVSKYLQEEKGKTEDDVYMQIKKWESGSSSEYDYAKSIIREAAENPTEENRAKVIKESEGLIEHGKKKDKYRDSLKKTFADEYRSLYKQNKVADLNAMLRLALVTAGYTDEEAKEILSGWLK